MVKAGLDPVAAGIVVLQGMSAASDSGATAPSGSAYQYDQPRFPQAGNTIQTHSCTVSVAMRINRPVITLLEGLMSSDECDMLVELSRARLQGSTVVDPINGKDVAITDRKSSGTFFAVNESDFIARLDRRIAEIMHWPVENGEGLQILNYQVGGEYKPHYDYFPPEDPGSATHLTKGGQRVSTLIIYLNDVPSGGETIFPNIHLSVSPKKGSAVYFEYCNDAGHVDPLSLHGGKPVIAGEKWIATKWMRQRRYC